MKKKITVVIALLFIASLPLALFGCNRKDTRTLLDIYKSRSSVTEFTGVRQEMILPMGWSVCVDRKNSDFGYIESLNAFVITDGTVLSIMKCGAKKELFPKEVGIDTLRVVGNLIAVKLTSGEVAVYTTNGNIVLSSANSVVPTTSVSIDNMIKILDNNLIAINSAYSVNSVSGYTSIFRPNTNGKPEDKMRGELVCRVKNVSENLANVDGFDGRYVSVTKNKENSKIVNRIFTIPDNAGNTVQSLDATPSGKYIESDVEDYFCEITYLGGSRFLVHEDSSIDKTENYTYKNGDEYVLVNRRIYRADIDKLEAYTANSDKIFLNLTNKYYGITKAGTDSRSFLQDGYMYAAYGLWIDENKNASYDQYILDSNLNIVLSLTRNFGLELKQQERDKIGFFDLILDFVDGVGYVPVLPSVLRAYDKNGKVKFENSENVISSVGANDGIFIAQRKDEKDDEKDFFGAIDMSGKIVIPFIYDKLEGFIGYYTIGERQKDGEKLRVLIGKDGKEVETMTDGSKPLFDVAVTNTGKEITKLGCYMFAVKSKDSANKDVVHYGIKNMNANSSKNVIMPATMISGCTLYAPSKMPKAVFVFEKITNTTGTTFAIYRLI